MTPPPLYAGKGLKVKKFAHCLRIVFVIEKYRDIFRREGDFLLEAGFHEDNFPWGGKF